MERGRYYVRASLFRHEYSSGIIPFDRALLHPGEAPDAVVNGVRLIRSRFVESSTD